MLINGRGGGAAGMRAWRAALLELDLHQNVRKKMFVNIMSTLRVVEIV
jgi:hypothetical protein